MNLYSIHCGYYDEDISEGIYEFHINIPVVAQDLEEAKLKVRQNSKFKTKKMHIDGIQEIKIVDGFKIELKSIESMLHTNVVDNHLHRDL